MGPSQGKPCRALGHERGSPRTRGVGELRPFVEWNLRLWDAPRRFLAHGLLPTAWLLWLGVYPTVVGVSRGQWDLVTFGLGELVLGLGLVLFLVRRNARFRRTAAVNGWPRSRHVRGPDSVPDQPIAR